MPFLYTTSFLSFITMPEKEPGIKDFRDLSKAVLSTKFKCFAPKGTADEDLLLKSNTNHLKILGEAIKLNNWKYGWDEELDDLIDDSTALIMSRQLILLIFGDHIYTDKKISEDSFGVWNIAIALRKNFCCKKQLDTVIFRLLSSGLYKKWFDDEVFLSNLPRKLSRNYIKREISLSFEDLKSSIFILIMGFSLSLIVLLAEIFSVSRFYKRILKLHGIGKRKN
ncbi:hypothetical protein AVEN_106369-2 [Araneus ventricosus]|nr:hypothetical protein AVEN_106369-2 [Araneus ventricosus]